MKIALLVLAIIEKVVGIVMDVIKAPAGKTPEQVRDEIKQAIDDGLSDAWLKELIAEADAEFNKPGVKP